MAPSRRGRSRSNTLYLDKLTLLLSGDIELCPGPAVVVTQVLATNCITRRQPASLVNYFNVYFSDHTYDFITITETWLREDIFGNEVLSDSFNIYRRERDSTAVAKSKKCHGGGDLVAVNRTYCSKRRLGLETNLEILWTQTRLTGVYFPTWSDVDTWSELDKSLELLFILYINDLTNPFDAREISLYADDSKLFREISSVTDCQLVQTDLDSVCLWCETWHLKRNTDKCCIMTFTNKNKCLSFVYTILSQSLPRVTIV